MCVKRFYSSSLLHLLLKLGSLLKLDLLLVSIRENRNTVCLRLSPFVTSFTQWTVFAFIYIKTIFYKPIFKALYNFPVYICLFLLGFLIFLGLR